MDGVQAPGPPASLWVPVDELRALFGPEPSRAVAGSWHGGGGIVTRVRRLLDGCASAVARRLVAWLVVRAGPRRWEWMRAIEGELDVLPGGTARLAWALGGARAAVVLLFHRPARSRARRDIKRFVLITVLGAPRECMERPPADRRGARAIAAGLASLAASGLSLLLLRGMLEDSPYRFNLGVGAPAGVHPDLSNPLSAAWDLVVLCSTWEVIAALVAAAGVARLASATAGRRSKAVRWVRTAVLAASGPLWLMLAAVLFWGIVAHQTAPSLFDRGPQGGGGDSLTWAPWLAIVAGMAVSAAMMTWAGLSWGARSAGSAS